MRLGVHAHVQLGAGSLCVGAAGAFDRGGLGTHSAKAVRFSLVVSYFSKALPKQSSSQAPATCGQAAKGLCVLEAPMTSAASNTTVRRADWGCSLSLSLPPAAGHPSLSHTRCSFPYITCEMATVDVSDALGKVRTGRVMKRRNGMSCSCCGLRPARGPDGLLHCV